MANGNYLHAETSEERISIAIEACNVLYYKTHPGHQFQGYRPPAEFYREYLRPFIDYEKYNARLEELHAGAQEVIEVRQTKLVNKIHKTNEEIQLRLDIKDEQT